MSDDELQYVKRQKVVHFGAIDSDAIQETSSDNVNVSTQYIAMDKEIMSSDKVAMLEEFERRKKVKAINVSTSDTEVKEDLRKLGEPICLFGEGPADRRNRLRELLGRLGEDVIKRRRIMDDMTKDEAEDSDKTEQTWYHEGPDSLRVAREWIANFSIPKAKARLEKIKKEAEMPEKTRMAAQQEVQKKVKQLDVVASQIADTRPVSYCQFSPDNQMLATASWSGVCKLWNVSDCNLVRTLRGHSTHVGAITWCPTAKMDLDNGEMCLASCASDGSVKLWSLDSEEPLADIEGHDARVSRCAYHPSGR